VALAVFAAGVLECLPHITGTIHNVNINAVIVAGLLFARRLRPFEFPFSRKTTNLLQNPVGHGID
jgi:hypothetical protein